MYTAIIQGPKLSPQHAEEIANELQGVLKTDNGFEIALTNAAEKTQLRELGQRYRCDINVLPNNFARDQVKLIISDMDSTLIAIECIDEIADFIGAKPQVAAITESAMRGEIDFSESLKRRVGLLEGLPVDALEKVYEQRLRLNPGAEALIATAQANHIHTALVSGGFTFFTNKLQQRLGLDSVLANQLEIENGKLTGRVLGDIVDGDVKLKFLNQLIDDLGITAGQTVALGDGANDLKMLNGSGLGVAYHAKPKVQDQADCCINHNGLDAVLGLLNLPYQ